MKTRATLAGVAARLGLALALVGAGCGDEGTPGAIDTSVGADATLEIPQPEVSTSEDTKIPEDDADDADDAWEDEDAALPCAEDECDLDGVCWGNEVSNPDNPCEICLVLVDRFAWTPDDAATCDDGDACTSDDACLDGLCVGAPKVCSDGDPCTDDHCDAETAECSFTANRAPCDDGDPCTVGDQCAAGACGAGSGAPDCDDGNPCTTDTCVPGEGCVSTPTPGATCDDGNACTTGDACDAAGQCAGGAPLDCDDDNFCTIDACQPATGCVHKPIDDLCTDDNPCTDEACDPAVGCVYPFNSDPCDDGSLCTHTDTCTGGACVGLPVSPDDGNPCTDDYCDPAIGPFHAPNTLACDDGSVCTIGDVCKDGACQPGATPLACDDGNACTADGCDPVDGCTHEPAAGPCDDGTVCTTGDTCDAGQCKGQAVSCDDGNACTADSCHPVDGCKNTLVVSNACRPDIVVTHPPRAATLQGAGGATVTVTGTVTSGAGPIQALTLNGEAVTVASDGSFSHEVVPTVGGNILEFEASDSFGTLRKRVQSFVWGTGYDKPVKETPKSGMANPGLGIWLSKQVLDDGDHNLPPNDFATIFELVLGSFDINSFIDPNTAIAVQAGYHIYIKSLAKGATTVTLNPKTGGFGVTAVIHDVTGDLWLDCVCSGISCGWTGCWLAGGDTTGGLSIDSLTVTADVQLSVGADGALVVNVANQSSTISGLDVWADNGWTNLLLSIVEAFIKDSLVADLEDTLNDQLSGVLAPMLQDALGALAFNTSFDIPRLDGTGSVTIDLVTDFASVPFTAAGGSLIQRAGAYATKAVPYDNLGSARRNGCGGGGQQLVLPKASPIELGVSDDLLNQILYAAWLGGLLEFDVPASMLGSVDLAGFGVTDLVMHVSGMVQPTASDCYDGQSLIAQIGDLRIDATLKLFGTPMTLVVYASLRAGLELSAADDQLGIGISEIQSLATEVNVLEDKLVGSEAVLDGLIQEYLVPGLLGALGGDTLGGIPLPEIDLSGSVQGVPPGTVIAINPQSVTRDGGNTIVSGSLK